MLQILKTPGFAGFSPSARGGQYCHMLYCGATAAHIRAVAVWGRVFIFLDAIGPYTGADGFTESGHEITGLLWAGFRVCGAVGGAVCAVLCLEVLKQKCKKKTPGQRSRGL